MHCNCKPPSVNQVNSPVEGILFVIGIGIIIYVLYRLVSDKIDAELVSKTPELRVISN